MKIVIIGGGPAGVAAAISAKNDDNEVLIIEKNMVLLKKLLLTGAGRCNYFNEDFCSKYYNSNNHIVEKVINYKSRYLEFLHSIGMMHYISNGYYYPFSKSAVSVKNSLLLKLKEKNVDVIFNFDVKKIMKTDDGYLINNEIFADKIIITTGSKAYPITGSTGEMCDLLFDLGIKINPLLPALVQLKSSDKIISRWPLLRLNACVKLYENNDYLTKQIGEVQLTNYGISGICVLSLSHMAVKGISLGKKEEIKIDFLPNILNYDEFIYERSQILKNRTAVEFFEGLINYKLLTQLFKYKKIDCTTYFEDLSVCDKLKIKNILTDFALTIDGFNDFDQAQVTQGGVDVSEVNENFELIKLPNVYVSGEVVDVHGECGGYNLAFAFISGIIAGESAGCNDKN